MADRLKQVILGVLFPGTNEGIAWSDQPSGSHMKFASFAHVAKAAEMGKFDFFFLTEDLQLREQGGRIHDLDIVGRPDNLTILTALAAVTTELGLAGTVQTTYNEPYEIARQLATLDHLSDGRAAWNVVTSPSSSIGANFRRGGYLDYGERYLRAAEFLRITRKHVSCGTHGRRTRSPRTRPQATFSMTPRPGRSRTTVRNSASRETLPFRGARRGTR